MDSAPVSHEGIAGGARDGTPPRVGASVADAVRRVVAGRGVALAVEIALVGAYLGLRIVDAPLEVVVAWTVAAAVVALAAPVSGLVVLAAVGPFSDPFLGERTALRAVPVLIYAAAAGVAVRELIGIRRDVRATARVWTRPPLLLAGALLAWTALGVVHTYLRFGPRWGAASVEQWIFRIAAALTIVAIAYWAARRGETRPFVVLVASATLAGILSLASLVPWLVPALQEWVTPPQRSRLVGVIPNVTGAPNDLAALLLVPASILAAAAIWARDVRLRAGAAALAGALLVAVYLTYSRSALLAIFAVALIFAWRIRRRLAAVLAIAGLVAAIVLVPPYLEARGLSLGGRALPSAGSALSSSDNARIRGWTAAVRMWVGSPIIGQGYRSWPRLRRTYGVTRLPHAHNPVLMLLAETGIVGAGLGVAFVATSFRAIARRKEWLLTGVIGAFAAYCVIDSFHALLGFLQVTVVAFAALGAALGYAALQRAPPEDVRPVGGTP